MTLASLPCDGQKTVMSRPPFYEGPPRFDVGLKPIEPQDWLLPDDQADWLTGKSHLIDHHRDGVFQALASSVQAQQEAANLVSATCQVHLNQHEPPLLAAARLVSDDLIVMEKIDDAWTNTACCFCSPTFFSASHALGKSLALLHEPVPDGDFGLAARIGRVFTHLPADRILERHNWTVQWSEARYTPDGGRLREAAAQADVGQSVDQLFLRVERQTIRALPQTGAILFTIRIRLSRLADLLADPTYKTAFEQAWSQAAQPVRTYKKWAVLEPHVAHLLKVSENT
jgi:dimethylamine monooxygenase subunit A